MMMLKFINAFYRRKQFDLYNYGNHYRDFTYIGDVVKMLEILLLNEKKIKRF